MTHTAKRVLQASDDQPQVPGHSEAAAAQEDQRRVRLFGGGYICLIYILS